jgi:hypothetical protein
MRTPDDPTSTRQKRICEQGRVESKSVPVFVPATVPVRTETPANIVFMGKRAGEGNRTRISLQRLSFASLKTGFPKARRPLRGRPQRGD